MSFVSTDCSVCLKQSSSLTTCSLHLKKAHLPKLDTALCCQKTSCIFNFVCFSHRHHRPCLCVGRRKTNGNWAGKTQRHTLECCLSTEWVHRVAPGVSLQPTWPFVICSVIAVKLISSCCTGAVDDICPLFIKNSLINFTAYFTQYWLVCLLKTATTNNR